MSRNNKSKRIKAVRIEAASTPKSPVKFDGFTPKTVAWLDLAFGGDMQKLIPPIPEEFTESTARAWFKFQADWFFCGINAVRMVPKPGINKDAALAHMGAIQASWGPKHEVKARAVAYLASIWFEAPDYDSGKRLA